MRGFALPIGLILIAMVSIQSGAALAKTLFPLFGTAGTTALRLAFASVILSIIWRPWRKIPKSTSLRWLLVGYGISLGTMNLLFYFALERIPLGIAVAIEFTGPLGIALLTSRKRADFLWAFLAAVGIILIAPHPQASNSLDPVGVAFAFGAGFCWALYIFFGQRVGRAMPAGIATSLGMLIAALIGVSVGVIADGPRLLNFALWPLAFLMAIFSSALPYSLEMLALKKLPTQVFGILMSVEPALAAISGFVFLGERLSLTQKGAIFLVVIASAGVAIGETKTRLPVGAPLT